MMGKYVMMFLTYLALNACNKELKTSTLQVDAVRLSASGIEVFLVNPTSKSMLMFLSKIDGRLIVENTEIWISKKEHKSFDRFKIFSDQFMPPDTLMLYPNSQKKILLSLNEIESLDSISFEIPFSIIHRNDTLEQVLSIKTVVLH